MIDQPNDRPIEQQALDWDGLGFGDDDEDRSRAGPSGMSPEERRDAMIARLQARIFTGFCNFA